MLTDYMIITRPSYVWVHHDITEALDNDCMAAFILFDLSTAFEVIDHGIQQKPVEYSFGVALSTLFWIQSYLSDRIQAVSKGTSTPEGKCLTFGMPQ